MDEQPELVECDAEWVAWMRRVYEAAFAFVYTPIDDPESGALYRELAAAVKSPRIESPGRESAGRL